MRNKILERHVHPKYDRLQVRLRTTSRYYQAWTFLDNRQRQHSLKTPHLVTALKLAEAWYRSELKASSSFGRKHPIDRLTSTVVVSDVYRDYKATIAQDKQPYVEWRWGPIAEFWRQREIEDIGPKTFREFYGWRRRRVKGISNHTIHKDVVLLRQLLKFAADQELIDRLPVIPRPGRITSNPRPWFTKEELAHLRKVSERRIDEAAGNVRLRSQRRGLDDFMRWLMASMMRVGEARSVRFRHCRPVLDGLNPHLIVDVTGKTGHRTVVCQGDALEVHARRLESAEPEDLIFPELQRDGFRELLIAAGLRKDGHGHLRNLKSLRCTAIAHFILDHPGKSLQLVARNAGTSLLMIDQFYAKRLSAEMAADDLAELPAVTVRRENTGG